MTNRLLQTVLRHTESLSADATPDAELARRFADSRDEPAFVALVRRHGPMVWAVCRQMLPHAADADDAFQAVFLALIRSANQLGRVNSLGGWLHGAAVRVCLKARRTAARRKTRERATAQPERATAEPRWDDLHAAVHEEVEQLPETLRAAFVLCDLQGVRQPDAAARLGWKLGTLSGRLTRARQLLLKNLTARGLTPAVAVGAVSVGGLPAASAEGALALIRNGANTGSGVSSTVLELARGATEGMMAKVKWTVSAFMLTTGLVVVAGLPMAGAQRPAGGENARLSPPTAEPAPARAADLAPPAADLAPPTVEAAGPVARSAQRFEHLVVERPVNATRLTSLFREKELDGWEYVGIVPMEGGQPCLVFKRPKGGARTASAAPTAASPSLTVTDGRGNMYRTPDDAGRYAPSPAYPNPRALPTTPSADATPTATIPNGASRTPDVAPAPASKPATTAPRTPPADADSNTIPARQVEPPADPTEAKLPSGFEVVPLKHARATEVSKTLRELFTTEEPADRFGRSQPFTVSADDRTNSVIFRPGRGVTSRDVKAMIEKLDAESSKSSTRNPFSNTR